MQLRPTTSAPASSSRLHASGIGQPSNVVGSPMHRERDDRGQAGRLIASSAISASPPHESVSAMTKSTPASAAQPTCSSNIARTGAARRVVAGEDVRVARCLPARSAPVSRATCFAISSACRLSALEVVLPADDAELVAVGVVGERLDDVRAGVDEVAVELVDDLRMLEHDLGDERARLQVAAALELEDVALGADHGALLEALEQGRGPDLRQVRCQAHPSTPCCVGAASTQSSQAGHS